MFWSTKPTIDADDEEWQFGAWAWLMDTLGGVEAMRSLPTRYPRPEDFPRSYVSREAHLELVFRKVCKMMRLDAAEFDLRIAEPGGFTALLTRSSSGEDVPVDAAATYQFDGHRQIITYRPELANDMELMIGIFAHELCHSILLANPERPDDWGENEEFMTDLAVVFMGFGLIAGNNALKRSQIGSFDTTGTVGLRLDGFGYMRQNEWAFALALRTRLIDEDPALIRKYATSDFRAHFDRNYKYLAKNQAKLDALLA